MSEGGADPRWCSDACASSRAQGGQLRRSSPAPPRHAQPQECFSRRPKSTPFGLLGPAQRLKRQPATSPRDGARWVRTEKNGTDSRAGHKHTAPLRGNPLSIYRRRAAGPCRLLGREAHRRAQRERERERVCVCVREREREGREGEAGRQRYSRERRTLLWPRAFEGPRQQFGSGTRG